MGHPSYQGQSRLRVSLPLLQLLLLLLLRLRCCSCRIADEGDLFVRSRYDDPCGLCGCNFANAAMGAEKVVVDDHQPHKRGTFCPESAGGLDAVLEFAVKPLVLVVMTEAVLQVNLPDVDQPEAVASPKRPAGGWTKTPAGRLLPAPTGRFRQDSLRLQTGGRVCS